jgi:hypothetical protein
MLLVRHNAGSVMSGMRRREFVTLLAGAAAAWPLPASAQQINKLPKIGVLWHADNAEQEAPYLTPLQQSLSNLGYVDGRNMRLLNTYAAERYERFNSMQLSLRKYRWMSWSRLRGRQHLPLRRRQRPFPSSSFSFRIPFAASS